MTSLDVFNSFGKLIDSIKYAACTVLCNCGILFVIAIICHISTRPSLVDEKTCNDINFSGLIRTENSMKK